MVRLEYEDFELVEQEEIHSPWMKMVFTVEATPWGPKCTAVFTAPKELIPTLEKIHEEFKNMIEKKQILEEKDWERLVKRIRKELFKDKTKVFLVKYMLSLTFPIMEQVVVKIY